MGNIIDYVGRASQSFSERPLSRVDSLVLSWLSYLRIPEEVVSSRTDEGVPLKELAAPANLLGLTAATHDTDSTIELLRACAKSPRFCDVRVCRAVDDGSVERQKQFCAMTFLGEGIAYVAYRGSDDTLVAWKENFNMAFSAAVPAQIAARDYLVKCARELDRPLWVGGHSKGGNLAVYAALTCDPYTRLLLKRVFSHDGPGFSDATISDPSWSGDYSLVDRTVPQESLVGSLLCGHGPEPTVVRSTNPGIMQHAPFSWVVEGDDFVTVPGVSYDAYKRNKRLNAWVFSMGAQERERFIEVLWKLARSTGEATFSGIVDSLGDGSLDLVLRRLDGLPQEDKRFFLEQVEELAATLLLGPAPKEPKTNAEHAEAAAERMQDATAKFNDRLSRLESFLQ